MWSFMPFIIFGLVMIVFLTFVYISKLYKFKGTKLKTRMSYALAFSLFFTLFFLWQTDGKIQVIGKGLLLGGVLSVPLCFYSKRWLKKRIEKTTIFYKPKQHLRNLLWAIPVIILFWISSEVDFLKQIPETLELIFGLGVAFAWFISQVFILFYIVKLEKKLGEPILEDEK